jgi:hypothetical protein
VGGRTINDERLRFKIPAALIHLGAAGFVCTIAMMKLLEWIGNVALVLAAIVSYFYFRRFLRSTGLTGFRRR